MNQEGMLTDRFYHVDVWRLLDFISKLGLEYPLDDEGAWEDLCVQARAE